MGLHTVQEIERAISTLTPKELEELYEWFDQHVHALDTRIRSDLAAGRLDNAIQRALSDEKHDLPGSRSVGIRHCCASRVDCAKSDPDQP